jgi:hypothetical protein
MAEKNIWPEVDDVEPEQIGRARRSSVERATEEAVMAAACRSTG